MSLQIPARSGGLRRLLHLGGAGGIGRPYSTGDRRRRVIREARQEEEDEAFLRTLNFGADPENNPPPPPPPPRSGGAPDSSTPHAAFPTDILRRAAGKQQQQREERPEGIAQKAIGESLMEKLKLGDAGNATSAAAGNGGERPQPEREPTKPPPEQEPTQPQDVDEIFRKMKETGLIPNAVAMLDGLCKNGLVQDAMKLFGLMREKGSIPEVVVYTAVVEAFCKGGKLDDAVRIFRKMQGNGVIPNAFSYWLLVQGLCKGGRLDDAVDLCVEMFEAGHSPNAMTFVGLVDAVCKAKGVEEGEKLVRSFQDRNFAIDEKSIREHLDKKGPFSPVIWEILTKVAFSQGTSTSVLVLYRHIIAIVVLLPVALAVERRTAPPLSFKVSLSNWDDVREERTSNTYPAQVSASMNISCIGLNYASATSASAVQNLVPVLTFFLAVLLGMESLKLKMCHGVVKVCGIVFCAVGVTVLALYQGPDLKSFINHHLFPLTNSAGTRSPRNWILGIFLQSLATSMWALWAVLQGPLLEEYPSKLLNTTVQIVFSAVQSFFMALVIERDFSRWKLGFDVGLVAIIYCGIVVSAISFYMQIWVIDKRGPVFLCMTVPLTLVITIILSFLIGEAVTLGSVTSGALMVAGLYTVLWGKRIEQVAINNQGGDGEETTRSDLEEQETAVLPASQDVKEKICAMN